MQHLYTSHVWFLSLIPTMQTTLVWMAAYVAQPVSDGAKVTSKHSSWDTRFICVSPEHGSHGFAPTQPGHKDTRQGASSWKLIKSYIAGENHETML